MNIIRLEWDSEFFGYEVGYYLTNDGLIPLESELKQSGFRLIYIMSQNKLRYTYIDLMDEKAFLNCEINSNNLTLKKSTVPFNSKIHSKQELLELNLKSGIFSRFYIDKNFSNSEYEKLYNKWMIKCIEDNDNFKILIKCINSEIAGFVALKINENLVDIQLLAVDPLFRGKGIGSLLLNDSKKYALNKGFKNITVTTQLNNIPAMSLYEKNNFSITNIKNIYHYWNL